MDGKPLAGQLALVTGASRGIGAATAEALATAGAHVVLVARTASALEAVEGRIHDAGGTATIAPLDLTEGDAVARLAQAVAGRWPALDLLVLNAAVLGPLTPVPMIEGAALNRVLTTNLLANHVLLANFDAALRASPRARIVAVTSSVGAEPRAYWGAYAASKAALEALLLTYADEVENLSAIRVAIVDPGATATAMRAAAFPGEDAATLKGPEVVGDAIARLLADDFPTGRRMRVA